MEQAIERARKVRAILTDVDGILTDGEGSGEEQLSDGTESTEGDYSDGSEETEDESTYSDGEE